MYSMTGFAHRRYKSNQITVDIQLKSVNHRFLAIRCELPKILEPSEDELKEIIKKAVKRGTLTLKITIEAPPSVLYKKSIKNILQLYKDVIEMKKNMGIEESIPIDSIVPISQLATTQTKRNPHLQKLLKVTKKTLSLAVVDLLRIRQIEGEKIKKDLRRGLKNIKAFLEKIERRKKASIVNFTEKLQKRVDELLLASKMRQDIDSKAIAKELVLLVEKSDISEECERLRYHVEQFEQTISKQGEAGKQLEFLVAEMIREVNTLLAKSMDAKISSLGIKIKLETEKIKERVENVE